jgi:hypothetical protein
LRSFGVGLGHFNRGIMMVLLFPQQRRLVRRLLLDHEEERSSINTDHLEGSPAKNANPSAVKNGRRD